MKSLYEAMSATSYPGRGIVVGKSADGARALVLYFIMGRSVNSRNRVFVQDGDGLRTEAYDPKLLKDPSLIIYSPVRVLGAHTVVTNGDQTDTVYEALYEAAAREGALSARRAEELFAKALTSRTFEPDAPNYTPRVSAILTLENGAFSYAMNILKSADGCPDECVRFTFSYPNPINGAAHFLHTYACDGSPIPSFSGEPEPVQMPDDIEQAARDVWAGLDKDNRVALFARSIELAGGRTHTVVINSRGEE